MINLVASGQIILFAISMYMMDWAVAMLVFTAIMGTIFLPVYLAGKFVKRSEDEIERTMQRLAQNVDMYTVNTFLKHPNYPTVIMCQQRLQRLRNDFIDTINSGFFWADQYKIAPAGLLVGFVLAAISPNPMNFMVLLLGASLMVTFVILFMGHKGYVDESIENFNNKIILANKWEKVIFEQMHTPSRVTLN